MRAAVLALALAGCAAAPQAPRDIPLRNPTAPVASQADAGLERLAGDWVVVQGAELAPGTPVSVSPDQWWIGGSAVPVVQSGQGRFDTLDGALWVHWLDIGNRTAAVGDPGGSRVWIMDRSLSPGPDRLQAAREILAWYGYDLSRLEGL